MSRFDMAVRAARSMVDDDALTRCVAATKAIHTGHHAEQHPGTGNPVIPPLSLSTTFRQKAPGDYGKYDYSRAGNYNREVLEETIAALEEAAYCCSFSSGLATLSSIIQMLSSGDHGLFFNDVYGGTSRYFSKVASKFNISFEPVDMQDLDKFKSHLKENTKMIWIETPSNPMMRIVDIKKIAEISKKHNPKIIVIVDNTFLTPVFQLPLTLGADIVMHSLTKYINGHSDVLMGAAATNNLDIFESLRSQQLMVGAVPSPFDCYLALRGLRTLTIRMRQHQLSGLALALYLKDHPMIEKVMHPALFDSPQKEIILSQMKGFSGMLSIYIKASKDDTIKVIQSLKYFQIAESLGGFESLIEIPSLMTHMSVPPEQRKHLGITDNLVRISVGLEDIYSLIDDFDQALEKLPKCGRLS